MKVRKYIKNNWQNSVRTINKFKNGIKLPFPYSSPCVEGLFDDLYYWDTYFINKGLLLDREYEQAKNNILDIAFLIEKYGFMPNCNREDMLTRSQPPFFSKMVEEYFDATNDIALIKSVFPQMKREYDWWNLNRSIKVEGVNMFFYSSNGSDEFYNYFYNEYKERVKEVVHIDKSRVEIAKNAVAECESGWDFSPRFNQEELSYFPIDLNSLMYKNELILDRFFAKLYKDNYDDRYLNNSKKRKEYISKHFIKDGIFYDYNYKNNTLSDVVSCASFFPYGFSLCENLDGFKKVYTKLNKEYGIATTEKSTSINYQWAFPNLWSPLVVVAFMGAINLNENSIAKEIASKYVNMIDNEFERTGALWEKYDALTGKKSINHEYAETEMLGWTAGAYVVSHEYLKGVTKNEE